MDECADLGPCAGSALAADYEADGGGHDDQPQFRLSFGGGNRGSEWMGFFSVLRSWYGSTGCMGIYAIQRLFGMLWV